VPIFLYPTLPPDRASDEPTLKAAAAVLGATEVAPSIDASDVVALERSLAKAGAPPPTAGEGPRWEEAGWWLVPLIALFVLGWFRRGWVLS